MSKSQGFDAHEAAPSFMKDLFKFYQKLPLHQLDDDPRLIKFNRGLNYEQRDNVHVAGTISRRSLHTACGYLSKEMTAAPILCPADVQVYEVDNLPGEWSDQD